jgi:predicted NUDIX family NTP pyrophosphohydrolase
MFRRRSAAVEVLLAHPGGPYWRNRDLGVWSLPKGKVDPSEELCEAARREFCEETGLSCDGTCIPLGEVHQKGGKVIHAWAFEGDCDPASTRSNTFSMEWPPKSGRMQDFPEIDRTEFFSLAEAKRRLNAAQAAFVERLELVLSGPKFA